MKIIRRLEWGGNRWNCNGVGVRVLMTPPGAQWEVVKIVARQRGGAVDNLLARRSMRGSRGFLY